jgi:hypothetical protein
VDASDLDPHPIRRRAALAAFAAFLGVMAAAVVVAPAFVDRLLPPLLGLFAVGAVFSAVILVRAALVQPRIGALVERAILAVLLAVFGVIYAIVALNTELGRALFSTEVARVVVRFMVITVLAVPTYWTWLLLTGRLGDNGKGGQ